MPPESGQNVQIANRLFLIFALLIGTDRVRGQEEVRSPQFKQLNLTAAQIFESTNQ